MPARTRLAAAALAGALFLSACGVDQQPPAARPTVTPPATAEARGATATANAQQPAIAAALPTAADPTQAAATIAPTAAATIAPTAAATAAPTIAPIAAATIAPTAATLAAAPAAQAGPLQFYWIDPPAGTVVLSQTELSGADEAGWSIAFSDPADFENNLALNGGERAPAPPDINEPGTYKEELQVRGVPAVYESSGYGFRIAWREEGVNYNVVAGAAFGKEQVLELIRQLEPLTLEQWRARLQEAGR